MSDAQNVSILNQTILHHSLRLSQNDGQREREHIDPHAADVLNARQNKLKSPILRNVVKMPRDIEFHAPDGLSIDAAYNETDIELKDSHRNKVLEESRRKFTLQERLAEKLDEAERLAKRPEAIQISLKEALKLDDKTLIKNVNRYKGNAATYLGLRYDNLRNRYYSLLTEEATKKLTREDLVKKIKSLYEREPEERNAELISYLQNLVCIRDIEEKEGKKKNKKKDKKENAERLTDDELKKNRNAYNKNADHINSLHISEDEKNARKALMKKVMLPEENETFLSNNNIKVNGRQREGMRQILSWMYRNCVKTSESKLAFVHKLASAGPSHILLTLYLVENGKQDLPDATDFYEATHGYVPNLDAFKDKMISSKAKFWNRMKKNSQDSVINWSLLGKAARFSLTSEDTAYYEYYKGSINSISETIKQDEDNSREKRDHLIELLSAKGNLLLTYYRSAGLTPDMPIDMIGNAAMRSSAMRILEQINKHIADVIKITEQLPEEARGEMEANYAYMEKAENAEGALEDRLKVPISGMKITGRVKSGLNVPKVILRRLSHDIDMGELKDAATGIGGIGSILGAILAINEVVKLSRKGSELTGADRFGQTVRVGGKVIGAAKSIANTATHVTGKFVDLGSRFGNAHFAWYGNTQLQTASEAFKTTSGAVGFTLGCVSILEGTMKTVSGIVELGRNKSSRNDIKRSKEALQRKAPVAMTADQKVIRDLLDHRSKVLSGKKTSAAIRTTGGVLKMAGGALMTTGMLAPVGIGLGLLGAVIGISGNVNSGKKKKKNRADAVDKYVNMAERYDALNAANPEIVHAKNFIRNLRQETLAEMGYATYKECYSDLMKHNAALLYDHVFNHTRDNDPDWDIYFDALKSLGMKIKIPNRAGEKPVPPLDAIYACLMK